MLQSYLKFSKRNKSFLGAVSLHYMSVMKITHHKRFFFLQSEINEKTVNSFFDFSLPLSPMTENKFDRNKKVLVLSGPEPDYKFKINLAKLGLGSKQITDLIDVTKQYVPNKIFKRNEIKTVMIVPQNPKAGRYSIGGREIRGVNNSNVQ